MRQIVLDTETTGLAVEKGNRVIEIGCVEICERRPTGRHFQRYLNPDREIEQGAQEVTGLTLEFLADKPRFEDVVDEFLGFIAGAELIIHNAPFDVGFLDAELARLGGRHGRITDHATVTDSLARVHQRFPGQRNSLDALCRRLEIDNAHRELHGALLDAQLLAEVYLAMTAGQGALELASQATGGERRHGAVTMSAAARVVAVRVPKAERELHAARIARLAAASGRNPWAGTSD